MLDLRNRVVLPSTRRLPNDPDVFAYHPRNYFRHRRHRAHADDVRIVCLPCDLPCRHCFRDPSRDFNSATSRVDEQRERKLSGFSRGNGERGRGNACVRGVGRHPGYATLDDLEIRRSFICEVADDTFQAGCQVSKMSDTVYEWNGPTQIASHGLWAGGGNPLLGVRGRTD
jgi:hypothetical protein